LTNGLQEKIWEQCKYQTTIFNLLLLSEEEKEMLIPELKNMFDNQCLDKKSNIDIIIQKESEKSGIGKIFSSISSKLAKKPAYEDDEQNYYSEESEVIPPGIEIEHLQLSESERQKVKDNLKALYQ
jgi:hypothetical protein